MRFRAATVKPPMTLLLDRLPLMPAEALGIAAVPAGFVPMRLPAITFALLSTMLIPAAKNCVVVPLPEMTFPAPGCAPPTVVPELLPHRQMPLPVFGTAADPAASRPMKLPTITVFTAGPETLIPFPPAAIVPLPEITFREPATTPPMVLPGDET